MTEPVSSFSPPSGPPSSSNRALWSLILGIVGIFCCGLVAPVAWYLGNQELKSIRAGQGDPSQQGLATAGMVLGIIATVLLALAFLWVAFFGGLAFLSALGH
jgi:hypothetical protein